jgi:predicted acylesterase/phospholipase RssA
MWTMRSARARAVLFMLLGALAGCSTINAYYNEPLPLARVTPAAGPAEPGAGGLHPIRADTPGCFQRARPWGPDVLAVTLSGGGSRAAVFGAAVMLELQDIGALDSVDLVSSVSGGSLAAALYALSRDPGAPTAGPDAQKRIVWSRDAVIEMTSTDLLAPWILRWLRPDSIAKYWFTAYDRTDLFVETLNSKLLSGLGKDDGYPTFADLNPERATLILNATNFTAARSTDVFTFTPWDFETVLNSDICSYDVARGVSASAAFPGVLQYSTLRDFRPSAGPGDQEMPASYVDLMDGGATDNLGLKGLNQALEQLHLCGQGSGPPPAPDPCRKLLVLIVDAQNGFQGRDPSEPDPRGGLDRLFDTNFLDAYDTLMQTGYGQLLHQFRQDMEGHPAGQADGAGVLNLSLLILAREQWLGYDGQYGATTCPERPSGPSAGPGTEQFALERACALAKSAREQVADVPGLGKKLRGISTNWRIDPDQVACLEVAAYALVAAARPELEKFVQGEKVLGPQDAARFAQSKSRCVEQPAASS